MVGQDLLGLVQLGLQHASLGLIILENRFDFLAKFKRVDFPVIEFLTDLAGKFFDQASGDPPMEDIAQPGYLSHPIIMMISRARRSVGDRIGEDDRGDESVGPRLLCP